MPTFERCKHCKKQIVGNHRGGWVHTAKDHYLERFCHPRDTDGVLGLEAAPYGEPCRVGCKHARLGLHSVEDH